MRALPARRIASSALCAALLVGITGPVAMAADSTRGHGHAASDARLPGADVRLVQIQRINWGTLTPVADLLNAVLRDNGRLSAAEATKLGDAAKTALAEAAAEDEYTLSPVAPLTPAPVVLPAPVLPAPALVPERRAADPVTDLLDLVLGAVDGLLQGITGGAGGLLPLVDDLLGGVDELLAELTSGEPVLQDEDAVPAVTSSTSTTPAAEPDDFFAPEVSVLTPLLPPAP